MRLRLRTLSSTVSVHRSTRTACVGRSARCKTSTPGLRTSTRRRSGPKSNSRSGAQRRQVPPTPARPVRQRWRSSRIGRPSMWTTRGACSRPRLTRTSSSADERRCSESMRSRPPYSDSSPSEVTRPLVSRTLGRPLWFRFDPELVVPDDLANLNPVMVVELVAAALLRLAVFRLLLPNPEGVLGLETHQVDGFPVLGRVSFDRDEARY